MHPSRELKEDSVSELISKLPQRYTLCITLQCNLACEYCYVSKRKEKMPLETAVKAVDFIFHHAVSKKNIEIGFFGGEPLLEFELIKKIIELIKNHPDYNPSDVSFSITTNGTIFSAEIGEFLKENCIKTCISCDGTPKIQNLFRRTIEKNDTAALVEQTIINTQKYLNTVLVNAVYHPQTFRNLPETLDYFSSLGIRKIFLNPDFTAVWNKTEAEKLEEIYDKIAEKYISWYLNDDPHFVSLIDTKLAVLMRGGYHPLERCQMGKREMAITPDGGLYPCERLIGSGNNGKYRIGSIEKGPDLSLLLHNCAVGGEKNNECLSCQLKDLCMNWCGCSNVFMSGYYNRVNAILCASEKALINSSIKIFSILEKELGPVFLHHLIRGQQWN
jgi:uncharacterized protein